ncbi:conserved membrane protein of unknown function [Candidatus Nitrotoga arctica]|uniref:4-amino-4-deoxy-L-arabinose transferase n=2 Tax=Candidatus Nitrotoga arctica TaxID=453162 RepID=A0ABN8AJ97_9PROT|nr:conserved membrane protein of unknown function [Candidatus Nitrotoga arctica]
MSNFSRFFVNQRQGIAPPLIRLSLGSALTALVLWLAMNAFGPILIEQAYQGRSLAILNSMITGQGDHPVSEYISAFLDLARTGFFCLLALAGTLYLLANGIKHQAHRHSVTHLNAIVFVLLCALIVLRDPTLFTGPRFWAEEATVFFRTAYLDTAWDALIAPHQGYYMLWANLAGLLATIPPLKYAPVVTTGMSLLILLLILVVIMKSESVALDSTLKKAIAGVAVLVVGATGEIWLTSINSQYYITLLVFLILIDKKHNNEKHRIEYFVTVLAGLSSVAANFLAPLFLLRYLHRREKADLVLFFILASTVAIQLVAIGYSSLVLGDLAYAHPSQARFSSQFHALSVLHKVVYYAVVYPLFSDSGAWGWFGAAVLLITAYLARRILRDQWEFYVAILLLTALSVVSSLGMQGGPRYAYPVAVILALLLVAYSSDLRIPRVARVTAGILLSASIAYWSWHYKSGMDNFRNPRWPAWSDEVKAWGLDPGRKLQAHPVWDSQTAIGLVWSVELPPK